MQKGLARLLVLFLLAALLFTALDVAAGIERAPSQITIPTRTPTPPPPATATPDDGGGNPPPGPTSPPPGDGTAPPAATPTSTATVYLVPTPEGGFYATAEPCGVEPTLYASAGQLNVRGGPGLDYPVVGEMTYLEVRPITGRAANSEWWQVRLVDDTLGWVADNLVAVQGYTGLVPLLDAPPLPTGNTPTPGARWEPTPNPVCTPPPTFTPSPSATVPASPSPTATATTEPTPTLTASPLPPEPSATPPPAPTAVPTNTPLPIVDDAEPVAGNGTNTLGTGIWLPLAGAGLLVAGLIVFLVRRR